MTRTQLNSKFQSLKRPFSIALFASLILFAVPTFANAGTLSVAPTGGTVDKGDKFIVDLVIDSEDASLLEATAVITFDPRYLQLVAAKRNTQLFATFPTDQQTTDNDNGVVMLTGFTQSGGSLYKTVGEPDVLARLTFEAIKTGTVTIDWEYNGNNEAFKSILIADGSPSRNVLTAKPSSVSFVIKDADAVETPGTGIFDNTEITIGAALLVAGLLMALGAAFYTGKLPFMISTDSRTIVRYD